MYLCQLKSLIRKPALGLPYVLMEAHRYDYSVCILSSEKLLQYLHITLPEICLIYFANLS
jgi:hypothetical protein